MPNVKEDVERFSEMLMLWTRAAEHPDGLADVRRRMELCRQEGDVEGKHIWGSVFLACCLRHRSDLEAAEQVAQEITRERQFRTPLIQLGLVLALRGKVAEAYSALQKACTVPEDSGHLAAQEFFAEFERTLNNKSK